MTTNAAAPLPDVTTEDFDAAVLAAARPVLVDFTDPGCGHCDSMELQLGRLTPEYAGRVDVVRVDARHYRGLAQRYGVLGLPVFVLFDRGSEVARLAGLPSKAELRQLLDRGLAVAPPLAQNHEHVAVGDTQEAQQVRVGGVVHPE